ncbi:MAG: hypothetical protein KDM63_02950 [Verrucomicrobiae bacterium]|nr:hypothetical protein [Verrucomicrobiae bacterium]
MRRYLLVSLLIGTIVSAAVLLLVHFGAFAHFGASLARLYRSAGFLAIGGGESVASGVAGHPFEVTLAVLAAFGAAWCVIDIPQASHKAMVVLLLMLVIIGLSPMLALYGVMFEPFSAMSAATLATAAGFFYSTTEHGMRKRVLLDVLGSRISAGTFRQLMNAKEPVRFAGGTRAVTVLTCRVFNHADLREKMEPGELVAMGNLFLRNTADFLMEQGAYLDESGPDMVRVFFGMVRPSDDHALQACRAALELRTRLRNLNNECETRWFQRLDFGVAIGSGEMTVGVYGSPSHHYLSGVGGETDFARRLAQANGRYGSDVLISARAYQLVKTGVEVRPMEMIYDPGRNLMTEIYQLLALSGELDESHRARRDAFWQGVILYRAERFSEALSQFSQAEIPGKKDGPLEFFIGLCESRRSGSSSDAAPASLDLANHGHARLISKM